MMMAPPYRSYSMPNGHILIHVPVAVEVESLRAEVGIIIDLRRTPHSTITKDGHANNTTELIVGVGVVYALEVAFKQ